MCPQGSLEVHPSTAVIHKTVIRLYSKLFHQLNYCVTVHSAEGGLTVFGANNLREVEKLYVHVQQCLVKSSRNATTK